MEHSARLLRHLAMGAVLTGLAAIFYFVGGHWAQRLLQERYLICPVYMVVFFVKTPGFLFCWAGLCRRHVWCCCGQSPSIAGGQCGAGGSFWQGAPYGWPPCLPGFSIWPGACGSLFNIFGDTVLSLSSPVSLPMRFWLYVARHPKVLSLGSALCGAALGILGFPACRSHTPPSSDAPSHILV